MQWGLRNCEVRTAFARAGQGHGADDPDGHISDSWECLTMGQLAQTGYLATHGAWQCLLSRIVPT